MSLYILKNKIMESYSNFSRFYIKYILFKKTHMGKGNETWEEKKFNDK